MHPRQASVVAEVEAIRTRIAGQKNEHKARAGKTAADLDLVSYVDRVISAAGQPVLWQYKDPDGNLFWLDRKVTTALRSPYGGSQFTPKGKRVIPSQIGRNIEDDAEAGSGDGWDDPPEFRTR